MPSPTPIISERVEEKPILEGSIPTPIVHKEVEDNTETFLAAEQPPIVQEGLDSSAINAPIDLQPQLEKTSKARPSMQEGDEMIQLPFTKSGDTSVQDRAVDPSINNKGVSIEGALPVVGADVEVTTS